MQYSFVKYRFVNPLPDLLFINHLKNVAFILPGIASLLKLLVLG
jgi:hypothetical protein